jgi:hypothetical protein
MRGYGCFRRGEACLALFQHSLLRISGRRMRRAYEGL